MFTALPTKIVRGLAVLICLVFLSRCAPLGTARPDTPSPPPAAADRDGDRGDREGSRDLRLGGDPAPAREAAAEERDGGRRARPDMPDEAMRWRLLAHRSEDGSIPMFGLTNARAQREALAAFQAANPPPAAGITNGTWTSIGPGNIGGRVRALVIHPTTTTTMFAGGVDGGIWKTTNSGGSWAPIDDFMANLAVSTIVMDPGNAQIMYAGTGEGFFNADRVQGQGIFKSTDGGNSWSQLAATLTSDYLFVNRLAIAADSSSLLAATSTGVFRTVNGGTSWTKVLNTASFVPTPGQPDIVDVKFLAGSSTELVAAGFARNLYYSNNGGTSFTAATGLVVATGGFPFIRTELGGGTSAPGTIYASLDQSGGQLYKSTDSGHSYGIVSTPGHLVGQGWYDNVVWVDPTNADTLMVGGIDLWRSTNAGVGFTKVSSWQDSPTSAHADHHAIVQHPGFDGSTNTTIFFGNDGGVYRTDSPYAVPTSSGFGLSIPFTELNNEFGVTQFYGAGGHAGTGKIVGGTQDNGTLLYTTAGGSEGWTTIFGGDGGFSQADPTDPNYLYGEYVFLRLHRTTNGVGPSSYIYGVPPNFVGCKSEPFSITDACPNTFANFIAPFVLDPNNAERILAGGWSLWRTNDARTANTQTTGPSWAAIKAPNGAFSPISAIAISPQNADVVWVGHNNGDVFHTTTGTNESPSWSQVDTNSPGLPNRTITSILADPDDEDIAYVTVGGFNSNNLWKTDNGGLSWTDISGSIPSAPIRAFERHPANPMWLYAGTEVGVFASEDGGASWTIPNDGPANVAIYDLFWMDTTLVAVTHGRGMFTHALSNPQQLTANPSVLNFGATKNGAGGALVNVTPNQVVTVGFTETPPSPPGPLAPPMWTATANQPWVDVIGGSGTGAGQFTVGVINPGNVIGGSTSLVATITIAATGADPKQVTVNLAVQQSVGGSASPFGQVDAPLQNEMGVRGAVGVSGWVLDDVAVQDVKVYRNCLAFDPGGACQMVDGHNVVFIGTAAFVAGARPDVAAAFPTLPLKEQAGWGFQILTNMLPHIPTMAAFGGQGTLQFYAFASDVEGHLTLLGRSFEDHTPTTVTLDNDNIAKPFGTLDTPGQGQTVSGLVANFGWALTPDTDTVAGAGDILIPTDGSTMFVFIDGMLVSPVTYNQCRGTVGNPPPGGVFCDDDVANIFGNPTPQPPGTLRTSNPTKYRNLDAGRGVIGSYLVDTGPLGNGLHSIAWSVTDSAGRIEGIGSRNFIVLNGGGAPPPAPEMAVADWLARPATSFGPAVRLDRMRQSARRVTHTTGFDRASPFVSSADALGVNLLDRLEVRLGGPVTGGYLVADDELRQLPLGSHLDAAAGVFTWDPPLGYLGTYDFVFVSGGERIPVRVTVRGAAGETAPVESPGGRR